MESLHKDYIYPIQRYFMAHYGLVANSKSRYYLRNTFLILIATLIIFSVVDIFTNDTSQSLQITFFVMVLIYGIMWYNAGKYEREELDRKKQKDQEWIDSLGNSEGKCMSCRSKLSKDQHYCENCGYRQKEKKPTMPRYTE